MKKLIYLIIGFMLVGGAAFASGSPEKEPNKEVFLLSPGKINRRNLANQYLMAEAGAFYWNSFKSGENRINVSLDAHTSITNEFQHSIATEQYEIHTYKMKIRGYENHTQYNGRKMTISFSYLDLMRSQGRKFQQPAKWALLEGIRQSGIKEGKARILRLSHNNDGGFQAIVEISEGKG